jgi:hypothetical protein
MEKELKATFDADTKRCHRFLIDDGQEVKGSLYLPKDGAVPDVLVIRLQTQADKEKEA